MTLHDGKTLRCAVLALLLCCTLPLVARAQQPTCGMALTPVDFETVTVSTTAIGLTAAKVQSADAAYVTIESTTAMRYRLDGLLPTTTLGHLIDPPAAGSANTASGTWLCGRTTLLNLRMIRSATADVVLRVTYYRSP